LNYKFYYTWTIKSENVLVADVEGHEVFLQTRGSLMVFENGEVASAAAFVSGDMIKWKGPFMQSVTIKFQDNSMIIIKSQGTFGGA